MTSYRINEIFYSLQGEGFWTGTPAVFVRFSGCNLRCPFCDTAHQAFTPMSADDILSACSEAPVVVLTGGEPGLQVDAALIEALHGAGYRVHIETNGTVALPGGIDWVTLSPKEDVPGLKGEGRVVLERRMKSKRSMPRAGIRSDGPHSRHRGISCSPATSRAIRQRAGGTRKPRWNTSRGTLSGASLCRLISISISDSYFSVLNRRRRDLLASSW